MPSNGVWVEAEPFDGEFSAGHEGRLLWLNDCVTQQRWRRAVAARLECSLARAQRLPRIWSCAIASGLDAQTYVQRHSLIPLHRVAAATLQIAQHGSIEAIPFLRRYGLLSARRYAVICNECVARDLRDLHTGIYRREHQILGATHCLTHGTMLEKIEAPNPFSMPPQHWLNVGRTVPLTSCGYPPRRLKFVERYIEISTMLLGRGVPLCASALNRAINDKFMPMRAKQERLGEFVRSCADRAWWDAWHFDVGCECRGSGGGDFDPIAWVDRGAAPGFAYAMALAAMSASVRCAFEVLEEAAKASLQLQAKTIAQVDDDEFFLAGLLDLLWRVHDGAINPIAVGLGMTDSRVCQLLRRTGLPSQRNRALDPGWKAFEHFMAGATVVASCRRADIGVADLERVLRLSASRVAARGRSRPQPE